MRPTADVSALPIWDEIPCPDCNGTGEALVGRLVVALYDNGFGLKGLDIETEKARIRLERQFDPADVEAGTKWEALIRTARAANSQGFLLEAALLVVSATTAEERETARMVCQEAVRQANYKG